MKKVFVKQVVCASICFMLAGCGVKANAAETTEASAAVTTAQETETEAKGPAEAHEKRERKQNGQMAKVVSVGDKELTVLLAKQPERKEKPEQAANGEKPEKPADGTERPEKPADGAERPEKPADGEKPEKPADGIERPEKPADGAERLEKPADVSENGDRMPQGGRNNPQKMEVTYSEEATTLTLTDETVISKGMGQEAVSLSEIEADSIIRVVLDENTIVSIEVLDSEN